MTLLVVRHGVAMEKEDYTGDDDFRPLTLDGIRKMKKNARGISKLVETPTLLVSSPLTRAKQTAEILQDVWEDLSVIECEALRPETKPLVLASWINERIESGLEFVVITGHEPHLSQVIHWMTGARVEMKKGGACLLEFDDRIAKHEGKLKWLAPPRFLRSI